MRRRFTIVTGQDRTLELGQRTAVVGVLNLTPDSFSDGREYSDSGAAIDRALEMEAEGADIVEIGAESTRPGARAVPADVELSRLLPVLERLAPRLRVPIAIDTYKSQVARVAIGLGAQVINDVSALRFDPELVEVVAAANAVLVLMHMRGTPEIMQKMETSPDILADIERDLADAVRRAIAAGVCVQKIILDPGIGFGKTLEQNLEIINGLGRLSNLGYPLMLGTSRKGFIGNLTGQPANQRQFGTAATVTAAVLNGSHLVRVHDVKEMIDVVRVADALAAAR
ncbi:MAG TPA: dihydropteroate synthase [Blastocatellia bacterium]|nr:dihydropteroate synthase [Blastocatellia bacterium]